jgi:hypothetical protein
MKRKLQRPAETLAWNTEVTENVQPPEVPQKHYFGPAQFYCVETICASCGVIIGWDKFAKSESPTKILNFLNKMYPTEDTRPDYIWRGAPSANGCGCLVSAQPLRNWQMCSHQLENKI